MSFQEFLHIRDSERGWPAYRSSFGFCRWQEIMKSSSAMLQNCTFPKDRAVCITRNLHFCYTWKSYRLGLRKSPRKDHCINVSVDVRIILTEIVSCDSVAFGKQSPDATVWREQSTEISFSITGGKSVGQLSKYDIHKKNSVPWNSLLS
jgi:hypothetical protein